MTESNRDATPERGGGVKRGLDRLSVAIGLVLTVAYTGYRSDLLEAPIGAWAVWLQVLVLTPAVMFGFPFAVFRLGGWVWAGFSKESGEG